MSNDFETKFKIRVTNGGTIFFKNKLVRTPFEATVSTSDLNSLKALARVEIQHTEVYQAKVLKDEDREPSLIIVQPKKVLHRPRKRVDVRSGNVFRKESFHLTAKQNKEALAALRAPLRIVEESQPLENIRVEEQLKNVESKYEGNTQERSLKEQAKNIESKHNLQEKTLEVKIEELEEMYNRLEEFSGKEIL